MYYSFLYLFFILLTFFRLVLCLYQPTFYPYPLGLFSLTSPKLSILVQNFFNFIFFLLFSFLFFNYLLYVLLKKYFVKIIINISKYLYVPIYLYIHINDHLLNYGTYIRKYIINLNYKEWGMSCN